MVPMVPSSVKLLYGPIRALVQNNKTSVSSGRTRVAQLVARSTQTDVLSVRVPPAELNISVFPPVLRDWVTKGLGIPASSMRLGI